VLKKHRYRIITHDDGTIHLYADRNRWSPAGSLAGHLSLVVILAGGIVGAAFGYRDDQFMITEGTTAAIPTVAGAALRLDDFRDTYYTDTGAPSDYASSITVLENGREVAAQTVRVNEPLRYGGLSFYQSFFGSAAMLTVKDTSGNLITSEGVPLAWESPDGMHSIGSLLLPSQNLVMWVIGTSGPDDPVVKPGQMRLELYDATGDGALVTAQTIDQGQPTVVGGVEVTFDRETQFAGLSVSRDPGAPLVWLGGLMLFLGIVAVFMFPTRRLWGRLVARPGGGASLALAAVGRKGDSGFLQEFQGLVDEIRQAAVAPHRA
jgi:cytochrome c biogenesis protein